MNHFVCLGWLRSHEFPRNATEVWEVVELSRLRWCCRCLVHLFPAWKPGRASLWSRLGPTASAPGARSHTKCPSAWNCVSSARREREENQSSSETLLQWSHHFDRDPSALPQQVIEQATGSAQNWDEGERPAQGHAPLRRQSHGEVGQRHLCVLPSHSVQTPAQRHLKKTPPSYPENSSVASLPYRSHA